MVYELTGKYGLAYEKINQRTTLGNGKEVGINVTSENKKVMESMPNKQKT